MYSTAVEQRTGLIWRVYQESQQGITDHLHLLVTAMGTALKLPADADLAADRIELLVKRLGERIAGVTAAQG